MINKHNIDSVNAHQLFHRILYWRAQLGCQEVWDLPCMKHKAHTKICPIRLPQLWEIKHWPDDKKCDFMHKTQKLANEEQ